MTETLSRPAAPPPVLPDRPHPSRARALLAGPVAALAAATAGLLVVALPVVLAWASDPRGAAPASAAARTAGQLWLVAHGAALEVPGGRVDLLPLGLALLPVLLLVRAGAAVARRAEASSVAGAAAVAAAVAVPYTAWATGVAALAHTAAVRPSLASTGVSALTLALPAAAAGALLTHGLWRSAWLRAPGTVRRALPAALAASGAVLAAGALLTGASLAVDLGAAAELARSSGPGAVGGAVLLLLGAALAPNAAVWGASWLAGPGFTVGTGTVVAPFEHALGPVPALPLLAALPAGAPPTWLAALALAVPLAAGAVAGRLLRTAGSGASLRRAVLDVASTSALVGALWAGSAALSGGAVGGRRLVELGPSPLVTAAALALEVAGGALVTLAVLHRRERLSSSAAAATAR